MKIKFKGKERELMYTFNSMKFMGDLDLRDLDEIEHKPFKMAQIAEILVLGAVNYNPKIVYTRADVADFLEKYTATESLGELVENLMGKLQESNFFKSLQKQTTPVEIETE